MYSNFIFLISYFLFELSCKNTHTQTWTHICMRTQTHTHEYSIVAFSKNSTIKIDDYIHIEILTHKYKYIAKVNNLSSLLQTHIILHNT